MAEVAADEFAVVPSCIDVEPGKIYRAIPGGPLIMDGVSGHVTYNVDTLWLIDGNLGSLPSRHPDVDLLLDARQKIALLIFVLGPRE